MLPTFVRSNGPIVEARFIRNPDGTPDGGVHALFTIDGRPDNPSGRSIAQENLSSAPAVSSFLPQRLQQKGSATGRKSRQEVIDDPGETVRTREAGPRRQNRAPSPGGAGGDGHDKRDAHDDEGGTCGLASLVLASAAGQTAREVEDIPLPLVLALLRNYDRENRPSMLARRFLDR